MKNSFSLSVFTTALISTWASRLPAQTFTVLHSFTATSASAAFSNLDGANPNGELILWGNTLYGTAYEGGSGASSSEIAGGTVFSLKTDGTGFATLVSLAHSIGASNPDAGLLLSGTNLYGTTLGGGNPSFGTVFAVNTNGTAFKILYTFSGSDGMYPSAGLISSGNTLYGTTSGGTSSAPSQGTVFAIDMDGSAFSVLYDFSGADGSDPTAGLVLSGSTLYGTTSSGGSSDNGTVFSDNTNGTSFTSLYNFTGGSDGVGPGGLVLFSNTIYGIAGGGSLGSGTIFAINTDGSGFTNLYNFTAPSVSPPHTNTDGALPSSLFLAGTTLYGAARFGGSSGNGTVFAISTDGTGFELLHTFSATSGSPGRNLDGANPSFGSLTLAGTILYGTAANGGNAGNGTVFSISLAPISPPRLTITSAGPNVILTWPTNAIGYTLQSTTDLILPAWGTNLPAPVILNGLNTVTNAISGAQQFFRLSQ